MIHSTSVVRIIVAQVNASFIVDLEHLFSDISSNNGYGRYIDYWLKG